MKKIALLVGISDYSNVNRLRNLNGCQNDLIFMHYILQSFYNFDNIIVLKDNLATCTNIKNNLEYLFSSITENDQMIFYFSGHGSHIYSAENQGETDNLDEVLCPFDMDWQNNFISDDYLNQVIKKFLNPNVTLEIIIDSCFSGGMVKGVDIDIYSKNKFLEMPLEFQPEFKPEKLMYRNFTKLGNQFKNTPNINYWLSCAENELAGQGFNIYTSCDLSFFTYSFCKNIQIHYGNISRQALFALIKQDFQYLNQTPQIYIENKYLTKDLFTNSINPPL